MMKKRTKTRATFHDQCKFCKQDISQRIKKYLCDLSRLAKARGKRRGEILKNASPCLLKILSECALNLLKGKIKVTPNQLKKLRPYGRTLVKTGKSNENIDRFRRFLKKEGGFLPIILPAIISALSGLAGNALTSVING